MIKALKQITQKIAQKTQQKKKDLQFPKRKEGPEFGSSTVGCSKGQLPPQFMEECENPMRMNSVRGPIPNAFRVF